MDEIIHLLPTSPHPLRNHTIPTKASRMLPVLWKRLSILTLPVPPFSSIRPPNRARAPRCSRGLQDNSLGIHTAAVSPKRLFCKSETRVQSPRAQNSKLKAMPTVEKYWESLSKNTDHNAAFCWQALSLANRSPRCFAGCLHSRSVYRANGWVIRDYCLEYQLYREER